MQVMRAEEISFLEEFDGVMLTSVFHEILPVALREVVLRGCYRALNPNPPKDTDGRREDSGRGWVRELQGRWPEVLG